MANINFLVKVADAKLADVQKALQAAGITVRSVIEIFREEEKSSETEKKK